MAWPVLAAALCGILGTGIGGVLGALGRRDKPAGTGILAFTAGLMAAIVSFELIPEAILISGEEYMAIGAVLGIFGAWAGGKLAPQQGEQRMGWALFIALMLHNFPEGLAIGGGWAAYPVLGMRLALGIALHDLPEGMAITTAMRTNEKLGMRMAKGFGLAALSGVPTALGAWVGAWSGQLAPPMVGISLGVAAGAMLYVCAGEMIPSIHKHPAKGSWLWQLFGFAAGLYLAVA